MNSFMSVLVKQSQELQENGVIITNCETEESYEQKIVAFFSCDDGVARPKIQNRFQSSGRCGCSWCDHFGQWAPGSRRYGLLEDDAPSRTNEEHLKDIEYCFKHHTPCRRIKGHSVFTLLKHFDMVWYFPPD